MRDRCRGFGWRAISGHAERGNLDSYVGSGLQIRLALNPTAQVVRIEGLAGG